MDPKSERNSNFKTSSNLTTYTNYLTAPRIDFGDTYTGGMMSELRTATLS